MVGILRVETVGLCVRWECGMAMGNSENVRSSRTHSGELVISLLVVLFALLGILSRLRGDQDHLRNQMLLSQARLVAVKQIEKLRQTPADWPPVDRAEPTPFDAEVLAHGEFDGLRGEYRWSSDSWSDAPSLSDGTRVRPVEVRVFWSDVEGRTRSYDSLAILRVPAGMR